jgi:hypothetical protein
VLPRTGQSIWIAIIMAVRRAYFACCSSNTPSFAIAVATSLATLAFPNGDF